MKAVRTSFDKAAQKNAMAASPYQRWPPLCLRQLAWAVYTPRTSYGSLHLWLAAGWKTSRSRFKPSEWVQPFRGLLNLHFQQSEPDRKQTSCLQNEKICKPKYDIFSCQYDVFPCQYTILTVILWIKWFHSQKTANIFVFSKKVIKRFYILVFFMVKKFSAKNIFMRMQRCVGFHLGNLILPAHSFPLSR